MYIYVHVYRPLTFYMQKKKIFKLEISKITPPPTPLPMHKKNQRIEKCGGMGVTSFLSLCLIRRLCKLIIHVIIVCVGMSMH